MLTMGWKLGLRRVREKHASLNVAVDEYKVRVKNLNKKADEKELNGMALLRELKRFKQEIERPKRENKLLRQMTEGVLDRAVQGAGMYLGYFERPSKALKHQYVGLALLSSKTFGACCGRKVTEPKLFSAEKSRKWAGRCEEKCSRITMQRNEWVWFRLLRWQ